MINRFFEKALTFGHRYGITLPPVKDHGLYKKSGPLKQLKYPSPIDVHYYAIENTLEGETCGFMLIIKGQYTWVPPDCESLLPSITKFLIRSDDPVEYFEHCRSLSHGTVTMGKIECMRVGKYSAKIDFKTGEEDYD